MANQSISWNSPDYFRLLDEANSSTVNGSTSGNTLAATNQSFQFQMELNRTDVAAKPSYETGSNFMLLLEDFGEYFYNYNGSGTVATNNTSGYEYPTNCSFSNSSCGDLSTSKCILSLLNIYQISNKKKF